jgi:MoaA/NifB/PqqE/SkfB family radical SAM enzyme
MNDAIQITKGKNTYDLHVMWSIHNKCNYECTYCPPELHDGDSQWLNLDHLKSFIDKIEEHYIKRLGYKNILFSFTGGEPTLWKDFKAFVQYIDQKGFRCGLTTNGSVSPNFWKNISHAFDYICMSFHPEKAEIEKFLKNYEFLHNEPNTVIPAVRVMMHHKQEFWNVGEELIEKLKKFSNWTYQSVHILKNYGQGSEKIEYDSNYKDEFLDQNAFKDQFKDSSLISEPEVGFNYLIKDVEGNTEVLNENQLINNDQVNFKGWNCYIGIEELFIHFSGDVKTAGCATGRSIGNVLFSEMIKFPTRPSKCIDKGCYCPTDIRISKSAPGVDLPYEIEEDLTLVKKIGTDKSYFKYRILLSITSDIIKNLTLSDYIKKINAYIQYVSLTKKIELEEICIYLCVDPLFDFDSYPGLIKELTTLPGFKSLISPMYRGMSLDLLDVMASEFGCMHVVTKNFDELVIASQLLKNVQLADKSQLTIEVKKGDDDQIKILQALKIAMKKNEYHVFELSDFEENDFVYSLIKQNNGDPQIKQYIKTSKAPSETVRGSMYLYDENIELFSGRTSTLHSEGIIGLDQFKGWSCNQVGNFSMICGFGEIYSSSCKQQVKLGHLKEENFNIDFNQKITCSQVKCENVHDRLTFKESV